MRAIAFFIGVCLASLGLAFFYIGFVGMIAGALVGGIVGGAKLVLLAMGLL